MHPHHVSRLIVTADDLGASPNANQAILESLVHGYVTHASLMVNAADTERAVQLVQAAGVQHRVGLHLNFTFGTPLTDEMRASSHFCRDGAFRFPIVGRGFAPLSARDREAVAAETRAQVARLRDLGLDCAFLDSHHHVHLEPNVLTALLPVARELGITRIRGAGYSGFTYGHVLPAKQALARRRLAAAGYHAYRFMGEIGEAIDNFDRNGVPKEPLEIMTHPDLNAAGEIIDGGDAEHLVDRLETLRARLLRP